MSQKREVKAIIKALESQGWRAERKTSGWMCYPPDVAASPVMIHETNSDHRWIKNTEGQVRRSGFQGKLPLK